MKTINLRWIYPHYRHDEFVEVSDEVWEAMRQAQREMTNYERRKINHHAWYSLDAYSWMENYALEHARSPEDILMEQEDRAAYLRLLAALPKALSHATPTQARRVYAYYISGITQTEISRREGVHSSKVTVAIHQGLNNMRRYTEPLTLESEPERVVVMTKSPVLALYELGIEMIAIPEAGSSTVWPEDLDAATEKLNTTMNSNFDIETVIALEPDLVVMGYTSEETYGQALDDADIPVYYVDAGHTVSYESTKSQTEALVEAFGEGTGAGEAMLARFDELEARLDSVKDQYADMKVMVLQSSPPNHYIQTSEGTLASMAAMMGFGNVYENDAASMAELDREAALSYDPDLVLAVGGSATAEEHQAVMEDDFANNPDYWNSIPAIAGGDILYFPASFIASNGIAIIDNINSLIDMVEAHFAE